MKVLCYRDVIKQYALMLSYHHELISKVLQKSDQSYENNFDKILIPNSKRRLKTTYMLHSGLNQEYLHF